MISIMRQKAIVVPRNVPAENFSPSWSVRSEKSSSCSVLKICVYLAVLVLLLLIIGVVSFLALSGEEAGVYLETSEEKGVGYVRKTDPCQTVVCPAGSVCHLGTDGQTVCQCADHCQEETDPVCGSDGVLVSGTL
jgi:hypothetical protein